MTKIYRYDIDPSIDSYRGCAVGLPDIYQFRFLLIEFPSGKLPLALMDGFDKLKSTALTVNKWEI